MQTGQAFRVTYTGNMSVNPTPPRVRMKERFRNGPTDVYARGYDKARFEPLGTADVHVEVAREVWRIRRVGVLREMETGRFWACGANLLAPVLQKMEPKTGVAVQPVQSQVEPAAPMPTARPAPEPPKPPVLMPSEKFLDRFGLFKKRSG